MSAEIVVIGGMNVDVKAKTLVAHRLETSNPGQVSFTSGGVARNIAHNLAVLGRDVRLLSCVGDDANGRELLAATARAGVDVSHVLTTGAATGHYCAVFNNNGELVTAVSDMRAVDDVNADYVAKHEKALKSARMIVADCNLPVESLQGLASRYGEKLLIDPVSVEKSRKLKLLLETQQLFAATPNALQAESLVGEGDVNTLAAKLRELGLKRVVIHLGPDGAFAADATTQGTVAPRAEKIVDVTGAGDAAVAGLVHGVLQGLTWVDAAAMGQQMAARVIASAASTLE